MAASLPGYQWKLYRNTGTNATPVWSLVTRSGDISLTFGNEELDDSARDSDFKMYGGGMTDISISVQLKYQTGNTDHAYFITSLTGRTVFEIAVVTADISTTGTVGLRTPVQIIQHDFGMALGDNSLIDLTLRPAYSEDSGGAIVEPEWITIS